jgi:hypothetical protein
MATKKRRKRATKKAAAPKRRRKSPAPRKARSVGTRKPKSTVRGQSDGELAKVFAISVRAGNRSAASKARTEMKRRSSFGEFDAARFPLSPDVLKDATALLKARKRRAL